MANETGYDRIYLGRATEQELLDNKDKIRNNELVVATDSHRAFHKDENGNLNRIVSGYVFDTIADLQNADYLKDGDMAEVLGYYEKGDGAGHKRIISNIDNGSGVTIGSLYGSLILNGTLNPKFFGAKGDGITDDTQSFIKCFACEGNILDISYGNYFIDTSSYVPHNDEDFTIKGNGSTIIITHRGFSFTGTTKQINLNIDNLNFKLSTAPVFSQYEHLISSENVNANITNCNFTGFNGDAVVFSNEATNYNTINNITIDSCLFDGVNRENRNAISIISAEKIYINNCTFINCTRDGMPGCIDFEPNFSWQKKPLDFAVTNCVFQDSRMGILMQLNQAPQEGENSLTHMVVKNCTFDNMKYNSILPSSLKNTGDLNKDNIINLTVRDCSFNGGGNYKGNTGHINCTNCYGTIKIIDNTFKKIELNGIFIYSKIMDSLIKGNIFDETHLTTTAAQTSGAIAVVSEGEENSLIITDNVFLDAGQVDGNGYCVSFKGNLPFSNYGRLEITRNYVKNTYKSQVRGRAFFNASETKTKAKIYDNILPTGSEPYNFIAEGFNIPAANYFYVRDDVSNKKGDCMFDYTLKKPIWWNGTVWVDATGTAI